VADSVTGLVGGGAASPLGEKLPTQTSASQSGSSQGSATYLIEGSWPPTTKHIKGC